ncbi:MAG: hypothetical protein R3E79_23915 [Caldilineaceae bacterium]
MSPRSPLFKSILWKAFAAGAFVGVTVQQPNRRAGRLPSAFTFAMS